MRRTDELTESIEAAFRAAEEALRRGDPDALAGRMSAVFTKYKDTSGYWRWHLQSATGEIVAKSDEHYSSEQECERAIALVKTAANVQEAY
jgi:uncharacterized protein YegP (UPF0339 family)